MKMNIKDFLDRIFVYEDNEAISKEAKILDNIKLPIDENWHDMQGLANRAYGLTGNVNAGLAVINFYFSNCWDANINSFDEFKKDIIGNWDKDSYDLRWPDSTWTPRRTEEKYFIDLVHTSNGHDLSMVGTYDWWLHNSDDPAKDIEDLGFTDAAKFVYFAKHFLCPQRIPISIDGMKEKVLNINKNNPDNADILLDILIDPTITDGEDVVNLDFIISKASDGLPAQFILETIKTYDGDANFDIADTVGSIKKTITSKTSVGMKLAIPDPKDDGPLSIEPLEVASDMYGYNFRSLNELFNVHEDSGKELNIAHANTDTVQRLCRNLDPHMFRKFVRINRLLKAVPLDMWYMMDLRDESGLHPGSFRVLMPTDPLWDEGSRDNLYSHDSRDTMIGNAEQILGHGVDGTWRWLMWNRVQNDMADIMRIRKYYGDSVPEPPVESAHDMPPEILAWVADGTIPKSLTYMTDNGEVTLDLTESNDGWYFRNGFWYLSPYDILQALPKTWDKASKAAQKDPHGIIGIYDNALTTALKFHRRTSFHETNPNWMSYDEYWKMYKDRA